jgi:hypothetical protein
MSKAPPDYAYTGAFNQTEFQRAYAEEFKGVPKANMASMPDLLFLLGKVGADPRITDVRWSAYILATAFIESSHTVRITKESVSKKGRVRSHKVKVWRNFSPIEEAGHGKGKDYQLPVKVLRLPSGDAQVTEYDGEQWKVLAATGSARPLHPEQDRGVDAHTKASTVYTKDDGEEEYFFGRGYVQLTWWNSYASAGVVLGQGLAFLFEPDLVNDRDVAYSIMATGLFTGKIFANGRRLSQYFHGAHTDYVGARNMVNAGAKHANKVEVGDIAKRFERVLLGSRVAPVAVGRLG